MALTNTATVTRFLRDGHGVATFTNPYDGASAVDIDPDGMVRSSLPVDDHKFALAIEAGGRAMNLLFPYTRDGLCAHGLVKGERQPGSYRAGACDCGLDPIAPNPAREA